MADKFSTETMAQGMRGAAETTLDKAKEAVGQYMKEASRVFSAADESAHAAQAGMRDVTRKAVGYAEANITAAFDFAQELLKAKDPQEFLKLQQAFVQKQAQALGAQMHEIGSAATSAASSAAAKARPKT